VASIHVVVVAVLVERLIKGHALKTATRKMGYKIVGVGRPIGKEIFAEFERLHDFVQASFYKGGFGASTARGIVHAK
jgi:hypothetical protein